MVSRHQKSQSSASSNATQGLHFFFTANQVVLRMQPKGRKRRAFTSTHVRPKNAIQQVKKINEKRHERQVTPLLQLKSSHKKGTSFRTRSGKKMAFPLELGTKKNTSFLPSSNKKRYALPKSNIQRYSTPCFILFSCFPPKSWSSARGTIKDRANPT